MTPDDNVEIQQLLARYGHAADSAPYELRDVFTADVVHDTRQAGGPHHGDRRPV
ncbi:nuclear transport factor 2 family protein [Nonomuraea sp. NPDC059023]|uniref:nuclear transport factor 2 family protein n=1 Tax=unclassified Nonomuraea TaxID=2593643 RepID=UPI003695DAE4